MSSIISVLLSWGTHEGGSEVGNFSEIPLDECGAVTWEYYESQRYDEEGNFLERDWDDKTPMSYNDSWRDGFNVTVVGKWIWK